MNSTAFPDFDNPVSDDSHMDDGPTMDPLDYASRCSALQLLLCPSEMKTRDWEALHAKAEIELREINRTARNRSIHADLLKG